MRGAFPMWNRLALTSRSRKILCVCWQNTKAKNNCSMKAHWKRKIMRLIRSRRKWKCVLQIIAIIRVHVQQQLLNYSTLPRRRHIAATACLVQSIVIAIKAERVKKNPRFGFRNLAFSSWIVKVAGQSWTSIPLHFQVTRDASLHKIMNHCAKQILPSFSRYSIESEFKVLRAERTRQ